MVNIFSYICCISIWSKELIDCEGKKINIDVLLIKMEVDFFGYIKIEVRGSKLKGGS